MPSETPMPRAGTEPGERLCVVMPAFNEGPSIAGTLEEWVLALRTAVGAGFSVWVIDDGSTDGTAARVLDRAARFPEIRLLQKPNSGHGESCLRGYRQAIDDGARWILQIDSDGQCDPVFFAEMWRRRREHPVWFGYRRTRGDGMGRLLVSRLTAVFVWLGSLAWIPDPNVPYRLIHATALARALPGVPPGFRLKNVCLSVLLARDPGIRWVPIHFRPRSVAGRGKSWAFFLRSAGELALDLARARFSAPSPGGSADPSNRRSAGTA